MNNNVSHEHCISVFLGGTCNNSTWRNELISKLQVGVDYYNPVVDEWTKEARDAEDYWKENSTYNLFVITKEMKGVYSIAEAVYSSFSKPTLFCLIEDGFTTDALASLNATFDLLAKRCVLCCRNLDEVSEFLNLRAQEVIRNREKGYLDGQEYLKECDKNGIDPFSGVYDKGVVCNV